MIREGKSHKWKENRFSFSFDPQMRKSPKAENMLYMDVGCSLRMSVVLDRHGQAGVSYM